MLLPGQTRSSKVLCVPKEIMYGEAQHGRGLHEAALFSEYRLSPLVRMV